LTPTSAGVDATLEGAYVFRYTVASRLVARGQPQIQRISGHESKKNLEVYQHPSLESVDKAYGRGLDDGNDALSF
jgi:hypothetical protein